MEAIRCGRVTLREAVSPLGALRLWPAPPPDPALGHPLFQVWGREAATARNLADHLGRPARQLPRLLFPRDRSAALTRLFHVTNELLQHSGVPYWLDCGTLLGWYREGGLIPWDYDIDFGLPEEVYPQLRDARLPRGFTLHDTSFKYGCPKLYVAHHGWEADLYFYRRTPDGGRYCPCILDFPCYGEPFPERPPQAATFLGRPTLVPADPEAYLRRQFGFLGRGGVRDPVTGLYSQPEDSPSASSQAAK